MTAKARTLSYLALAGLALCASIVTSCIPAIPGTNTAVCIFCVRSSSTGESGSGGSGGEASAEAPAPGLPKIPGLPGPPAKKNGEAASEAPAPAPASDPGLMLSLRDFTPPPEAAAGDPAPPAPASDDADPELAETLRDAEGYCATPCPGPNGHIHIGYGHLVMSRAEADELLAADMAIAAESAERVVGRLTWADLTTRRRKVLVEMAYMLGEEGLRGFERMLRALWAHDFDRAADEIVDSHLVPPGRVARLAAAMREG